MVLCILISDGKSLTMFEFFGYDFFSGQVLNLFPVVFSVRSSIYLIKFLEGSIFRTFRFEPTLDLQTLMLYEPNFKVGPLQKSTFIAWRRIFPLEKSNG